MPDTPTKVIVCCADHDHATDPACEHKAESVTVALTAAEIADRETVAAQATEEAEARAAAESAKAALKESAKAKLVAGQPLTADEASVLVL